MNRPEWHAQARCGRNGVLGDNPAVRVAVMFGKTGHRVCDGCVVQEECANAGAQAIGRVYGAWGAEVKIGQRLSERCRVCGTVFTPPTPASRVCSEPCRIENVKRINRETSRRARAS